MIGRVFSANQPDRELEERVLSYLNDLQRQPLREIRVAAQNGRVTLEGRVRSFYEKQLCLNCLRQIPGVDQLADQIEVD